MNDFLKDFVNMFSGLFCQSQEKSIQAQMAFLEASKQLSSVLKNRPEVISKHQTEHREKQQTSETPPGKTEERGDHHFDHLLMAHSVL